MLGKKPTFFHKKKGDVPAPESISEPATAPIPNRTRTSTVGLWVLTGFFVCSAILWLPSIASVALLMAAVLTCPVENIRQLIPLQKLIDMLPKPANKLSQSGIRTVLAGSLFVLGSVVSPTQGQFSVASYLDLQSASAQATRFVEYSKEPIDIFEYVTSDGQSVHILALDDINASHIGTQSVTVELSESIFSKQEDVEVVDQLEGVTISAKTKVLEYSSKSVSANKPVECSDADTKIVANNKINLSKVGNQSVSYTLKKGHSERVDKLQFEVRDTKSPVISLVSDALEIDKSGSFDPYANVASASDEVDGALTRVDTEPSENGNGWYTITGSYDVNNASKYYLTVVACDRNGNRVTKEFSLKVNNPPAASSGFPTDYETGGTPAEGTSYVINTNTGKFHYPGCRDVKRIAEHNRWDVVKTRDEVIAMGYVPCKHCNP